MSYANFKPMLSGECTDVNKLRYPVLVSPKLDGIRALVLNGVLVSRNLKPIPNVELQMRYGRRDYEGLDGELIAGLPTAPDCFRTTTSLVMSRDKNAAAVMFYAFDLLPPDPEGVGNHPFQVRRLRTERDVAAGKVVCVPHKVVNSTAGLARWEKMWLAAGYEGLMIRDPQGPYKQGRSTEKEGWLLKLKRFADAEAEVIGYEEQMANNNPATQDNLGHTKRSTHKANKAGKGTLGALICRGVNGPYKGVEFNVGTGFDDETRAQIWEAHGRMHALVSKTMHPSNGELKAGYLRKIYPVQIIKYRYFPSGSKEAPRFPVFIGFRDPKDMS